MPRRNRYREAVKAGQAHPPGWKQPRFADMVIDGVGLFTGAVALATVSNWREDATSEGKLRPVVLAGRNEDGTWRLWGLTSKPTFGNGDPREPAEGLEKVGLAPGFIWGPRLVYMPEPGIRGVVWAAPLELLSACSNQKTTTGARRSDWADWVHAGLVDAGWVWPRPSDPAGFAAWWQSRKNGASA